MNRVLRYLLVWSVLAIFLVVPLAAAPTAAFQHEPAASDSLTSVEVRLTSEPFTLKESIRPEGRFITFDSTLPLMGNPGEPALPVIKQMIGVPSRDIRKPTVKLAAAESLPALTHPLEPMPTLQLLAADGSLMTSEAAVAESYLPTSARYAQNEWYPANPVSISEAMTMRGQIVVQVSFTPVQVNLVTGEIRTFASADVSLAWATESLPSTIGFAEDPHHESVLASTLSNYEQARAWRNLRQTSHQAATFGGNSWMIEVEGKGLFQIPFSNLQSAGVDTSNPERLALYYGSGAQEQALWIDNNTLYFINTRDHNRWSKSIAYRLKVLTSGEGLRMAASSSPPNQSSTISSVPYELRFEEDQVYQSATSAAGASNRWYWKALTVLPALPTNSFSFAFDLPHVVTSHPDSATINVELAPISNGCHSAKVLINSVQYAEQGDPCQEWNDLSAFNQEVTVPHTALMASENEFEVEQQHISGVSDNLYLNSFTVFYERSLMVDQEGLFFNDSALEQATTFELTESSRTANEAGSSFLAFEVSTLGQAQRLTDVTTSGATLQFGRATPQSEEYLVLLSNRAGQISAITQVSDSGLRSNPAQTDYLIITPPEFVSVLQDFVDHRSQAYTVRLVTTTDIYHEFGAGVPEPQAIRDFLKYAYLNWNAPAPAYVLLIGDTTYDPFDIEETGRRVWVPPWLAEKDLFKGEIPTDQGYVAGLDAEDLDNDPIADMYIGRLPANSLEEAQALTQKIMGYETTAPLGEWRRSVFLVADDPGSEEDPEGAGNFHEVSDHSTQHFPESDILEVTKAYFEYDMERLEMRDQIAEELNKGHLIIQYIGHSSISQWADEGIWTGERQYDQDNPNNCANNEENEPGSDFNCLLPNRRLPLSLPWTCLDGYFIEPDKDSTSEQMLRLPDRGIIGAFAPTGLDVVSAHDVLTQKFYEELFDQESPQTQLGPLVSLSKQAVLGGPYERMMWTYTFLGDPAMRLNIAPCAYDESLVCEYDLYLPSIIR